MSEITEIASNDVRLNLKEVLDSVRASQHVHITRWSRSEAVMVPPAWYKRACQALLNAEINGDKL